VKDRERQARQDKKAIEFLEADKRRSRGEVQETRELLESKEQEVRTLKKDIENLQVQLKSLEASYAKLKQQSDQFQD
jgi:predicted  nucleic acid-binding Zn-ribbon protein